VKEKYLRLLHVGFIDAHVQGVSDLREVLARIFTSGISSLRQQFEDKDV
jgi:hypothetical protein